MPGYLCITHPFATLHRSEAFDLHVLGTPPAFILSQDQTLHLIDSFILRSLFLRILLLDVVFVSYSCSVFKDLCFSPSEECCINIPSIYPYVNYFYDFFLRKISMYAKKAACFQTAPFHAFIRNQSYVLTSCVQPKQERILHYLHAHLRCFRESHQAICLQLLLRVL